MSKRRVALITGASQGIGAEAAVELASRGYDLALLSIDAEGLEATAARVREAGGQAIAIAGDLADLTLGEAAVERTVQELGGIDLLVNNAAWRELGTMRTITPEVWDRTLRICLTAPAFLSRYAAAHMEKQRRGVIINVSSIQSQFVGGIGPAYSAAKGGLDSLTYELAVLYGPVGIRVVGINFGAIDTAMSGDYEADDGENLTTEIRRSTEDMIPLRRWASPLEAGRSIAWLAQDEASYVTGTSIIVDGGWTHQISPYSQKRRQFPNQF